MIFRFCIPMLFLLTALPGFSQDNPFISSPGSFENETAPKERDPENSREERTAGGAPQPGRTVRPPSGGRLFPKLAALQKRLNAVITDTVDQIREERSSKLIITILGISFLYGFIHALGPGHRKVIISSYFLSEDIRPIPGIVMAFSVAMLHGVAALILMSVLFFAVTTAVSISFNATYILVERISYGIIVLLGIYLVIHVIRERKGAHTGEVHTTGGPAEKKRSKRFFERFLFVLSNGAVPCPGAGMLLIFTFAYGLYGLGITAILAMSTGMGLLLSFIAAAVLFGKEKGLRRVLAGSRGKAVLSIIELAGGGAVVVFGLILLLGSL